jgi:hypothetical protein
MGIKAFFSLSEANPSTPGHFRWDGFHLDVFGMGQTLGAGSANLETPSEGDAEVVFRNVLQAVLRPKISPAASVLGQAKLPGLTGAFDQFKLGSFCSTISFICHRLNPFAKTLRSLAPPCFPSTERRMNSIIDFRLTNLSDESFKDLS